MNDEGLAEICRLLERDDMLISPDAVWLSSRPAFYGHLLALEAIAVSRQRALDILCPECGIESMRPQPYSAPASQPYRGHCPECGWVDLTNEQAHYWQGATRKARQMVVRRLGAGTAPHHRADHGQRLVAAGRNGASASPSHGVFCAAPEGDARAAGDQADAAGRTRCRGDHHIG